MLSSGGLARNVGEGGAGGQAHVRAAGFHSEGISQARGGLSDLEGAVPVLSFPLPSRGSDLPFQGPTLPPQPAR